MLYNNIKMAESVKIHRDKLKNLKDTRRNLIGEGNRINNEKKMNRIAIKKETELLMKAKKEKEKYDKSKKIKTRLSLFKDYPEPPKQSFKRYQELKPLREVAKAAAKNVPLAETLISVADLPLIKPTVIKGRKQLPKKGSKSVLQNDIPLKEIRKIAKGATKHKAEAKAVKQAIKRK